jgi:hypothetical protein
MCLRSAYSHLAAKNSDGNAIVPSKTTQHANTLKSGWQNKNAFRFDIRRAKAKAFQST